LEVANVQSTRTIFLENEISDHSLRPLFGKYLKISSRQAPPCLFGRPHGPAAEGRFLTSRRDERKGGYSYISVLENRLRRWKRRRKWKEEKSRTSEYGTKDVECVWACPFTSGRIKRQACQTFLHLSFETTPGARRLRCIYTGAFSLPLSLSVSSFQRVPSNEYSHRKQFRESAETIENLYEKKFQREIDAISRWNWSLE